MQVAIAFANEGKTFGKLPFKLAYKQADDQGSGTLSPAAAQELITDSNVVAVVGPAFSGAQPRPQSRCSRRRIWRL